MSKQADNKKYLSTLSIPFASFAFFTDGGIYADDDGAQEEETFYECWSF